MICRLTVPSYAAFLATIITYVIRMGTIFNSMVLTVTPETCPCFCHRRFSHAAVWWKVDCEQYWHSVLLLSANIRTSNLPNLLIIGIRGTQFVSCIYRVPVSIFVPLIIPLRREPCTISPNFCINAHITWLDNSHGASFIVIFVTCFSTSIECA